MSNLEALNKWKSPYNDFQVINGNQVKVFVLQFEEHEDVIDEFVATVDELGWITPEQITMTTYQLSELARLSELIDR